MNEIKTCLKIDSKIYVIDTENILYVTDEMFFMKVGGERQEGILKIIQEEEEVVEMPNVSPSKSGEVYYDSGKKVHKEEK